MKWNFGDLDNNEYHNNLGQLPTEELTPELLRDYKGKIFNRDFEWGRLTEEEIGYLNSLIEEYKDVATSVHRRNEIWRALNWSPIDEQFILTRNPDAYGNPSSPEHEDASRIVRFTFARTVPSPAPGNSGVLQAGAGPTGGPIKFILPKILSGADEAHGQSLPEQKSFFDFDLKNITWEIKYPIGWNYMGFWVNHSQEKYRVHYKNFVGRLGSTEEDYRYGDKIIINYKRKYPKGYGEPGFKTHYLDYESIRSEYNEPYEDPYVSIDTVPVFVLPQEKKDWEKMRITDSSGKVIYSKDPNDKTPSNNPVNPIRYPYGENFFDVQNLDDIIRAKKNGWMVSILLCPDCLLEAGKPFRADYEPQQIPDQEIVFLIRLKYGFAISTDDLVTTLPDRHYSSDLENIIGGNTDPFEWEIPDVNYYLIPFFDDEPESPGNLGKSLHGFRAMKTTAPAHKDPCKIAVQGSVAETKTQIVYRDCSPIKQIEALTGTTDFLRFFEATFAEPNKVGDAMGIGTNPPWKFYSLHVLNDSEIIRGLCKPLAEDPLASQGDPRGYNEVFQWNWNQIAHFSKIRAHWRASKILKGINDYVNFLEQEINKSVVTVAYTDEDNNVGIGFMSNKDNVSRPWDSIFSMSKQGAEEFRKDRDARVNGSCIPPKQYMRHMIYPAITFYISPLFYNCIQLEQTKKALDTRSLFFLPIFAETMKTGKVENEQIQQLKQLLTNWNGQPIDVSTETTLSSNVIKDKKKKIRFWSTLAAILVIELIGARFHSLHVMLAVIASLLETNLTQYKVGQSVATGKDNKAIRDISMWMIASYFAYKATYGIPITIPFTSISFKPNGLITLGITLAMVSIVYGIDQHGFGAQVRLEMENFVNLLNEATKLNVVEGVYAQTGGKMKVPKGKGGQLPIDVKTNPDGTVENVYQTFSGPEKKEDETPEQYVARVNREFIQNSGRKFFPQLTETECKTLLEIAGKPVRNRYNKILNSAPTFVDIGTWKNKERSSDLIRANENLWNSIEPFDAGKIEPWYTAYGKLASSRVNPRPRINGPKFAYTEAPITRDRNLELYLKGKMYPTSKHAFISPSWDPVPIGGNATVVNFPTKRTDKTSYDITDKEKVWLIRKKYSLLEIHPLKNYGGKCCNVFDAPTDLNLLSEFVEKDVECEYLIDFASKEFIEKVEKICQKREKDREQREADAATVIRDKAAADQAAFQLQIQLSNVKKDETLPIGLRLETNVYTDIEAAATARTVTTTVQEKQDKRRRNKRANKQKYDGTLDTSQNLSTLPKTDIASIPGQTTTSLPPTDSQTQQDIVFQQIDTERNNKTDKMVDAAINIVGGAVESGVVAGRGNDSDVKEPRDTPLDPAPEVKSKPYRESVKRKKRIKIIDIGVRR